MKIKKIILFITFLPYIYILLLSTYHAIFGYDVYTLILPTYVKTIYGIEAFKEVFILNLLGLTFIPIIPICLIYQIVYLIIFIVKKYKK